MRTARENQIFLPSNAFQNILVLALITFFAMIERGSKMVDINDYREEKSCVYKNEEYLVRDNGAVLRKARPCKKTRQYDNVWTFGKVYDLHKNYLFLAGVEVHRIVATAFHGEPPTSEHMVDHIDTNRHNNRPGNLRWITRLENVVRNEITRKKIEYLTGVSIYKFLDNIAAYRDALDDSDFSWMRRVTEEEAKACLDNIKRWDEEKTKVNHSKGKIGEWIYTKMNTNIIDSLTPLAKQKDWKTPNEFLCCPDKVDTDPIQFYLKNLSEDAIFSKNRYGESTIIKFASADNKEIVVITAIPSSSKPFALVKITFENGYYLHTSLGSFFTDKGAEKQFTLAQGLEWAGGDTFDDYC